MTVHEGVVMEARSSCQSRMAIDSLLNPSAYRHSDPIGYS